MSNTTLRWVAPALIGALVAGDLDAQSVTSVRGKSTIQKPNTAFGGGLDVINFEGLDTGLIVSQVFSQGGLGPVTVEGFTPSLGATNSAIIFDSANPTGDDFDLGTPNQAFGGPGIGSNGSTNTVPLGKVLICAEDLVDVAPADGLVDDPDDAAEDDIQLVFDFSAIGLVNVRSITVLDFEPSEGLEFANFFGPGNVLLGTQNLGNPGDNGVQTSQFNFTGVERIVIDINGSGAIDAIAFTPDCNANGQADNIDIETGVSADCNGNEIPDECDIASGFSPDCDQNGVPDECQPDCDGDGIPDACDDPEDCFDLVCAVRAVPDECADGILATSTLGIGGNFVFPGRGEFKEFELLGTATLKGIVQSVTIPSAQFDVCLEFSGLVEPGDANYPPVNSPYQELKPECYTENGGNVDTDTFRYYTTWSGTATGLGSLDGAVLDIVGVGAAFQIGEGANNKNQAFGGSGWFTWVTTSQPVTGAQLPADGEGDVNVDFVDCPPEPQ